MLPFQAVGVDPSRALVTMPSSYNGNTGSIWTVAVTFNDMREVY